MHFADDKENMAGKSPSRNVVIPKLTAEGYSMSPSIEQLERMFERNGDEALAAVDNFSVSSEAYGRVKWLEPVDIRGLDLDKIVSFEQACLCLYPEDQGIEPGGWSRLEEARQVTLYGILPKKSGDAAKEKYREKIIKQTEKANAELVEYNPDTGIWRFILQL